MPIRLIIFITLLIVIESAPVDDGAAEILKYEFDPNIGDGSYKFRYETTNGLEREEIGTVKLDKNNQEYIAVKGYYTYFIDQAKMIVNYEADEDGYKQTMNSADQVTLVKSQQVGLPAGALASLVGGGLG